MNDERYYQTVIYACGHPMLRATFRGNLTLHEMSATPREIMSWFNCPHCNLRHMRILEARMERSRGVA
jgi:hypothetical protein